jgi:syntaxin 5
LFSNQATGPGSGFPPDRKGKSRAQPANGSDYLALDIEGDGGESGIARPGSAQQDGFMQMQLVEQQVSRNVAAQRA